MTLSHTHRSTADYINRTIATVRNHRGADNCWPQWANIFADEIEDLRADLDSLGASLGEPCAECGHIDWRSDGYGHDLVAKATAALTQENEQLRGELTEWRTSIATEKLTWRAEAAEGALADMRVALQAMMPGQLGSEHEYLTNAAYHACVEIARRALAIGEGTGRSEEQSHV